MLLLQIYKSLKLFLITIIVNNIYWDFTSKKA